MRLWNWYFNHIFDVVELTYVSSEISANQHCASSVDIWNVKLWNLWLLSYKWLETTQMSWNDEACSCMFFNVLQIVYIFYNSNSFATSALIRVSDETLDSQIKSGSYSPKSQSYSPGFPPESEPNLPNNPRALCKKAPKSNESMTLWNPWNRTISTVLWVHLKLPQSSIKLLLCQATGTMSMTGRAKRFVIVPLQPYFGFHWFSMTTHPCPILPIQWTCSRWLS